MAKRESSADIDRVAAQWVARLDRAPLDAEEEARLNQWLQDDVRRQGAFAKANAVLAYADRARALGPGAVISHHPMTLLRRRRALMMGGGAIAACFAAGVGVDLAWQARHDVLTSAKGEVRRVPLADGSSVTLNTETVVRVRYTGAQRDVDLVSGEALFDVAKDRQRPFIVHVGDTRVRAVGTSFTVRRDETGEVKVVVREGVVEVVKRGQAAPTRVAANVIALTRAEGEGASAGAGAARAVKTLAVGPSEISRNLSWREGMLSFDGESLVAAAAEFERYSPSRIVIDDPGLGRETITGLFAASDPKGFARAVAISLNGKVSFRGDEIHLSR